MPKELLEFIKAINIARERKIAVESLTLKDLMALLQDSEKPAEETVEVVTNAKGYEPDQLFTSYKVRSLDGSIAALDLSRCDLVQYTAATNSVDIVWPCTSIRFDTGAETEGPSRVSKEELINLVNFISQ
jgi:hypothetical protein